MLAVMLSRLLPPPSAAAPAPFKDAASFPAWSADAIAQIKALGLIQGYEDGTFRPNREITRAELLTLLARAADLKAAAASKTSFADDSLIPMWAKPAVQAAAEHGLLTGRDGNKFDPNAVATRAETAALVLRFLSELTK